MHDIKWIRDNPEAFDTALKRRGLARRGAKADRARRGAPRGDRRAPRRRRRAQRRVEGDRRGEGAKDEARADA